MKNEEIIGKAAVMSGIMTEDEIKAMMDAGKEIPLHTLQGWNLRGNYKIKEGAEPIEVKLWKKKDDGSFYLAKAKLYAESQMTLDK